MIINPYVFGSADPPLSTDGDLELWLAAYKEAYADTDRIDTLTDWSGNARHFTQGTGANEPRFDANILNGKPGYFFDGTAYFAECAAFMSGDADVMMVLMLPGSQSGNGFIKFDGNSLASHCLFAGTFYESMGGGVRSIFTPTGGVTTAGWIHHVQMKAGTNEWIAYENGNTAKATTTQTVSWSSGATPKHLIGASSDQPNGSTQTNFFHGWLMEFRAWNRVLNSTERNEVLTAWNTRYGISSTSF